MEKLTNDNVASVPFLIVTPPSGKKPKPDPEAEAINADMYEYEEYEKLRQQCIEAEDDNALMYLYEEAQRMR